MVRLLMYYLLRMHFQLTLTLQHCQMGIVADVSFDPALPEQLREGKV